jgi:ectoine hydroxylase-related dioxygenase (phytanoyl-CoA dioxygenase family)
VRLDPRYAEDILSGGARYIQWNMALYDDEVLFVVPGSHVCPNTAEENAQLAREHGGPNRAPLPHAVQTHLEAGDAAVYILPLLHWAHDYSSARFRRTIHGGFAEFSYYPGLGDYLPTLSPAAQVGLSRMVALPGSCCSSCSSA